jgi:charged multivesicular body protein 7
MLIEWPCTSKTELRSTRTVVPLPNFLSAKVSIYDPGWLPARIAAYVVGKPLWWALEQMGVVGEEGILGSGIRQHHHKDESWWGDYVLVPLLERAADAVMERQDMRMGSLGDALYTVETFRTAFAGVCGGGEDEVLRETDVKVLVKYLEHDRGVLVADKEVRCSYPLPSY